jgi:class 6 POU domain transcription factor
MEPSKKRKRRTSFTPQALEILNQHFATNTHPSGRFTIDFSKEKVFRVSNSPKSAFSSKKICVNHNKIKIMFFIDIGAEITTLAHQLGYEREVIRIWFCNKRQALKNTVRMMSKDSPM